MKAYNEDFSATFPIKHWTKGVVLADNAMVQIRNVANLPFIHKHVAIMPDAHWGKGATVGSVIATKGAICPAAVGVDIGCGMIAARTTLMASDLPDNLHALRIAIEQAVPHGRTHNGGANDKGAFSALPDHTEDRLKTLMVGYEKILAKHPGCHSDNMLKQLGTLGGVSLSDTLN